LLIRGDPTAGIHRGFHRFRELRHIRLKIALGAPTAETRFARDSPLEGTGFELSVPPKGKAVPRCAKWVLHAFNPAWRLPHCARAGSPIMRRIARPNFARSRRIERLGFRPHHHRDAG
jgi:hypothetical protein